MHARIKWIALYSGLLITRRYKLGTKKLGDNPKVRRSVNPAIIAAAADIGTFKCIRDLRRCPVIAGRIKITSAKHFSIWSIIDKQLTDQNKYLQINSLLSRNRSLFEGTSQLWWSYSEDPHRWAQHRRRSSGDMISAKGLSEVELLTLAFTFSPMGA